MLSRALCPRLPILIDNPDELGADLLAGAIAARARCRMPAVVIDMGTATKLTALDAAGAVQGVSILPGMMVSLNALISGASQLSAVATQAPAHALEKTRLKASKAASCWARQTCWTACWPASRQSWAARRTWWPQAAWQGW